MNVWFCENPKCENHVAVSERVAERGVMERLVCIGPARALQTGGLRHDATTVSETRWVYRRRWCHKISSAREHGLWLCTDCSCKKVADALL